MILDVYNQSPISFVNELFRPNSVFVGGKSNSNMAPSDNLSIKSAAVSLQRTLTHPVSLYALKCLIQDLILKISFLKCSVHQIHY